jgi:RNA polymerase sigma factor (sigma-70 family)
MTTIDYNGFVNNFSDAVYRFILKNIQNEDDAKDIVQDAFEKLWLNRYEVDLNKVKGWLFTTAYRLMIDKIRKQKRSEDNQQVAESESTVNSIESFDLKKVLNHAFNTLPGIQKTVIMLKDYEGYNYKEIGNITGLSESQVKVYIYRGRMALKKFLIKPEYLI